MSHPRAPDPRHRFAELYRALYADLVRFVQRRVDAGAAEDVVAEVFLVVWRRVAELPEDEDAARAWVYGVARGHLMNARRGDRRRTALGVRLADATLTPPPADLTADAAARRVDLARAWRRLSAVHQEAIGLTALDGLSAPQAAAVLGISPVAYRLRLSRARRTLRLHLDHLPRPAVPPAAASGRTSLR
jgi:RNA polymerase sigma-70 factor (ECF subfamily)